MAYEFQIVDLFLFDFHVPVNALLDPAKVHPDFQFLTDPTKYNSRYQSHAPIDTSRFRFRPLGWRAIRYHFFWKFYQLIHQNGGPDFWKLQMPFVGHPRTTSVNVVTGSSDFKGTVRAGVFLSAIGWSTALKIRLRGRMKPSDIQEFVRHLSLKSAAPFDVNGARKTSPEVFELFATDVLKDVYQPGVIDALKVRRHVLITPARFSGEVGFYRVPGTKQIATADRAVLHSMLKGAPVSVPNVVTLERDKQFLITRFEDPAREPYPDFAITYFDYGTLLFMQRTAQGDDDQRWKARRSAMRCHAANVGNYLLMTLSLHAFYRDMKDGASSPERKALCDSIRFTLASLPYRYTNQYATSFHRNYGPLAKLLTR